MPGGVSCLLGTPEAQRKLREAFPPGGAKKETVEESATPQAAAEAEPPAAPGAASEAEPTATIQEGAAIPSVVFKCRVRDDSLGGDNPFAWKDVSTADLFTGKRVAIFALPGAFTPTCSSVRRRTLGCSGSTHRTVPVSGREARRGERERETAIACFRCELRH